MYTVGVITNILEGLGILDPKEQDDILDVVKSSSTISLELLKPKDFTDLVKSALTHLCERQEAELKKEQEEKAKKSKAIADALYEKKMEEAAQKEKEEAECELELKCKAEKESKKLMKRNYWRLLGKRLMPD